MSGSWSRSIGVAGSALLIAMGCSSNSNNQLPSGVPVGSCEGVAIRSGFCSCEGSDSPIQPVAECSAATMGTANILCCKSAGTCSCGRIECQKTSSDCRCDFASTGSSECTGTRCCNATGKYAGQCRCGGITCSADEVEVPVCSVAGLKCSSGGTRVDKCTP